MLLLLFVSFSFGSDFYRVDDDDRFPFLPEKSSGCASGPSPPPTPPRLGRRDPGPPPRVAIVARSADGRMSALAMHEYSFKNPVTTGVGNSVTAGKASLIEC